MLAQLLLALILGATLAQPASVDAPRPLLGRPIEVGVTLAQVRLGFASQQIGTGLAVGWHLHPLFAVQLTGFYNYVAARQRSLMEEVVPFDVRPPDDRSSLSVWGAFVGAEVAPLIGESNVGRLSFVLNAGVGLGGLRRELKAASRAGPASYADAGVHFLGGLGGGLRLEVTRWFAVRLGVHDVLFFDRVTTLNGCTPDDLRALDQELRNGGQNPVAVGGACNITSFGVDPATGKFDLSNPHATDVVLASNQLAPPVTTRIQHHVTAHLGVSFQF